MPDMVMAKPRSSNRGESWAYDRIDFQINYANLGVMGSQVHFSLLQYSATRSAMLLPIGRHIDGLENLQVLGM